MHREVGHAEKDERSSTMEGRGHSSVREQTSIQRADHHGCREEEETKEEAGPSAPPEMSRDEQSQGDSKWSGEPGHESYHEHKRRNRLVSAALLSDPE